MQGRPKGGRRRMHMLANDGEVALKREAADCEDGVIECPVKRCCIAED